MNTQSIDDLTDLGVEVIHTNEVKAFDWNPETTELIITEDAAGGSSRASIQPKWYTQWQNQERNKPAE